MLTRKPLKRGKPPRKRNNARRTKNHTRAYGSEERNAWLRAWVCMAWRSEANDCAGRIELAHTATGGMGRKADAATLIPLCHRHHHELHQMGRMTFEGRHNLILTDAAARCEAQWQLHLRGSIAPNNDFEEASQ